MGNYNDLVYTGADYKLFLTITNGIVNGTYALRTTDSIDFNTEVENELIHFVGDEEPGANKKNARSRKGKLNMQVGEIGAICALEGLPDATYIDNAILGAAVIQGAWRKTWKNVNIHSEQMGPKAKDKHTIMSMDFTALQSA